jgi:hypothetical protein
MPSRGKRALGAFIIVVWLVAWIAIAAWVGDRIAGAPQLVHVFYYPVAGVAWIFPLRPLFKWMAE